MDAATGELVRQRAGNLCEYCHLPQVFSGLRFHIEHIGPRRMAARMIPATSRLLARNAIFAKAQISPGLIRIRVKLRPCFIRAVVAGAIISHSLTAASSEEPRPDAPPLGYWR